MYLLFSLAILSDIGIVIASKWLLTKQKLSSNIFNSLQFWSLALFSALALWDWGYWDRGEALSVRYASLFGIMIAIAWAWNWLHTRALKHERIEQYELIWMTAPLFTVVLSALFLVQERDSRFFGAALLVSLILILTHLKRRHFNFAKYDRWLLLAVLLIAFEAVVIRLLLAAWSPAALYFARTLILALVFSFNNPPKLKNIRKKQWLGLLLIGAFGAIFKIIQYTAYAEFGIVATTMILVLSPALILVLDKLFLREKLHFRYAAGITLIGGTIIWALGAWEAIVAWIANVL